ncbi:MAG: copper chaperone PCu(A)C [Bacteroidota bacterium]
MLNIIAAVMVMFVQGASGDIIIRDQWMRPGAKDMNTAMYMNIVNNNTEADTLYRAECGAAYKTELHETFRSGDEMGMRHTPAIAIPGKSTYRFAPGGHHVMLIGLKAKISPGSKQEVTLYFRKAGKIKINVPVKKQT